MNSSRNDILWTIHHPGLWQRLVGERGWMRVQYERWCKRGIAGSQPLGEA